MIFTAAQQQCITQLGRVARYYILDLHLGQSFCVRDDEAINDGMPCKKGTWFKQNEQGHDIEAGCIYLFELLQQPERYDFTRRFETACLHSLLPQNR